MSGSLRAVTDLGASLRAEIDARFAAVWERIAQIAADIAAISDKLRSTNEELWARYPVDTPVPSPPRDFGDMRVRVGAAEKLLEALARRVAALEISQ